MTFKLPSVQVNKRKRLSNVFQNTLFPPGVGFQFTVSPPHSVKNMIQYLCLHLNNAAGRTIAAAVEIKQNQTFSEVRQG